MTTAGERLVALSGAAAASAGSRLASLAVGATAGEILVARSGLASATAAIHLTFEDAGAGPEDATSPFSSHRRSWRPPSVEQLPLPKRKRKRRQADILFLGH